MLQIDPNFKYHLSNRTWPYALPLVSNDSSACGIALYAYRCEYCTLVDHKEHTFIYYVFENKWFKLRIKTDENSKKS